jgi:hypothetical protein
MGVAEGEGWQQLVEEACRNWTGNIKLLNFKAWV